MTSKKVSTQKEDNRKGAEIDQPDVDQATGDERETVVQSDSERLVVDVTDHPEVFDTRIEAVPQFVPAGVGVFPEPTVRTSWDEQQDVATHEALAQESQADLAEREALKAIQDAAYLGGGDA